MKRWWLAGFLACAALFWSAITAAAAQGPIRSETRYAGVYSLRIDLYSDPPFTGKQLRFDVLVSATTTDQLRGLTLTAEAVPEAGTNGTLVAASVSPESQSAGAFQGNVTMQVRGGWRLRFTVSGPAGTNAIDLPLSVAAATVIPIWFAWLIGLAPLLGLFVFAVRQRSYLTHLQRAAFPA